MHTYFNHNESVGIESKLLHSNLLEDNLDDAKKLIIGTFNYMVERITEQESMHFSTLFTRIAYAGQRYALPSFELYIYHKFRRSTTQNDIDAQDLRLGIWSSLSLLSYFGEVSEKTNLYLKKHRPPKHKNKSTFTQFTRVISGILYDLDFELSEASFISNQEGAIEYKVLFNRDDSNEPFTASLLSANELFNGRFTCNLIDVDIEEGNKLIPKAFVILPDYLIDVSSVAECFDYQGTSCTTYLTRKILPSESSIHLLVGNIVNYFLDKICSNPSVLFKQLVPEFFKLYPLEFSTYDDQTIRELISKVELHFNHLKRTVTEEFTKQGIVANDAYLEPSFFSQDYGLQGRLDLFHRHRSRQKSDIVELKSGKIFRPNIYGINANHYIQTLLYDLLIKSSFGEHSKISNYILYSALDKLNLKYAPSIRSQQHDALRLRNELVCLEYTLERTEDLSIDKLLQNTIENEPKGFVKRDIALVNHIFLAASPLEKAYYHHLLSFVAREHHLAKIGIHGEDRNNGLASLWLDDRESKLSRFALLDHLYIVDNQATASVPTIVLEQDPRHRRISSFRAGDIVVLYPAHTDRHVVLREQVFKCNIIAINDNQVTIKLRSPQHNIQLFDQYENWNIEPDFLDSSFNSMYRSLFDFLQAEPTYKELILGIRPPQSLRNAINIPEYPILHQQKEVLQDLLSAKDYYLLWGPPGTGKTSFMLKYAVQYLYEETDQQILLIAYTNRAVDEICRAISDIPSVKESGFLKIGSKHSTDPTFRKHLLHEQIDRCTNRKQIREFVDQQRIVVGTVSSIQSKSTLFALKSFDTIIVDEASQIIEPMLVGLLQKASKFILIGDHKQLPAVVVQDEKHSEVKDQSLIDIGLHNMRDSLYERLLKNAHVNQWYHAFGILTQQGRMHKSLLQFPNQYFYESKLRIIPNIDRLAIDTIKSNHASLSQAVLTNRTLYIDTPVDDEFDIKTNLYESLMVSKILDVIPQDHSKTIGIITPYKAQIAKIKRQLTNDGLYHDGITIDTVERYQGSARDIIIISLCTNVARQMNRLSQTNADGVDRKLNVALTRAREQIIILGNREVLAHAKIYNELINSYTEYHADF